MRPLRRGKGSGLDQSGIVVGDEPFLQVQDDAAKPLVVGQLLMESLFKLIDTAFKLGNGRLSHKAPRVIGDLGTKKGKVTLPGLHEPPVLTDTGRRLANMYSTPSRCADGKTKKTALFTVWGTAKATVTPRVIWGISGCLKRGEVSRGGRKSLLRRRG